VNWKRSRAERHTRYLGGFAAVGISSRMAMKPVDVVEIVLRWGCFIFQLLARRSAPTVIDFRVFQTISYGAAVGRVENHSENQSEYAVFLSRWTASLSS